MRPPSHPWLDFWRAFFVASNLSALHVEKTSVAMCQSLITAYNVYLGLAYVPRVAQLRAAGKLSAF